MGEVMSIIAIVLLLALVAISVRKQRAGMTQAKVETEARNVGADVQRQRSLSRRAEAKAAARDEH
jgi:predicted Holliday junction resolvase-like endonuclease